MKEEKELTISKTHSIFLDEYLKTHNATLAAVKSGLVKRNREEVSDKDIEDYLNGRMELNGNERLKKYIENCDKTASGALRRRDCRLELKRREQALTSPAIAEASEILQFYTSVMRGEVLDQFGIEASLDTRIKAANEMAKHKIELPLKLEQKNITNNIGNIQLNFIPRNSLPKMSNNVHDDIDI